MLTTIGAGSSDSNKKPFDYAGSYAQSKLHMQCLERIDEICEKANDDNRVAFASEFATSLGKQSITVLRKAFKVYFRSPAYNVTRVMVSAIGEYALLRELYGAIPRKGTRLFLLSHDATTSDPAILCFSSLRLCSQLLSYSEAVCHYQYMEICCISFFSHVVLCLNFCSSLRFATCSQRRR